MKVYVADFGWAGSIVVIATSEEEARNMMKDQCNYEDGCVITVKDIAPGLVHANYGDL